MKPHFKSVFLMALFVTSCATQGSEKLADLAKDAEAGLAKSAMIKAIACQSDSMTIEEWKLMERLTQDAVRIEAEGYYRFRAGAPKIELGGQPLKGFTPYFGSLPGVSFIFEPSSGREANAIIDEIKSNSRITGKDCDFDVPGGFLGCQQSFDVKPSDDLGTFLAAYEVENDLLLVGCGYDYQI